MQRKSVATDHYFESLDQDVKNHLLEGRPTLSPGRMPILIHVPDQDASFVAVAGSLEGPPVVVTSVAMPIQHV